MTSSNQALSGPTKNLLHDGSRKRFIFSDFWFQIRHNRTNIHVAYTLIICSNHRKVRKSTRRSNSFTWWIPEVPWRKFPILLSEESLHYCECCLTIFVLFIISAITWQNKNKNLPIDLWNFFCEFIVKVTCSTSY